VTWVFSAAGHNLWVRPDSLNASVLSCGDDEGTLEVSEGRDEGRPPAHGPASA